MTFGRWTRRDCVKLLLAGPVVSPLAAQRSSLQVSNESMAYRFTVDAHAIQSKTLINHLTKEQVVLPVREFALEFDEGVTLTSSECRLEDARTEANHTAFRFRSPKGMQIRVDYHAPPGKAYLRKRISVADPTGANPRLFRAELENWEGVRRTWTSSTADRLPYGSHPIHCDTLWTGVEFPAAFNRYDGNGLTLASRPGGRRIGKEPLALRGVVAGVCMPGEARRAFLRYIDDIRHASPRMTSCYNSWWTTPPAITRRDVEQLIADLKRGLYETTGTFFDVVTTDAGWSDRQSIWQIDSKNMPTGFRDVQSALESLGAKMGLWISPSEIYGVSIDWDWARTAGYAVVDPFPEQKNHGISLADPRYRSETLKQLKSLIGNNDFHQIKYDGFIASEVVPHHDLLPDEDSVEPLAEYALQLMEESYQARPDVLTEPTFWNSWANYISPWVIAHGDSVWANAGGDCPVGIGPAPAYREAHTTSREYFIFSSLDEVWLPQNAVQYFDIIHCDAADGFANHVAMAVGRGRFFLATYINPKFMRPEDWQVYAAFVQWAKANQSLLRHTEVLRSRVEVGEPYAYGHWEGTRGVVVVRNPSNENSTYTLDLVRCGAPNELVDAVCYSIYPNRQGLRDGLSARDTLTIPLEPWQTLYLEILPVKQLKEPVVVGGRWFQSGEKTSVAASPNSETAILLEPGGNRRTLSLPHRAAPVPPGKVTRFERRVLSEPQWLAKGHKAFPSVAFDLDCNVKVPDTDATLLVLVEFPGFEHRPSSCHIVINEQEAKAEVSSSDGHLGNSQATPGPYWNAITRHQSHWTWYMTRLPAPGNQIKVNGSAGHLDARVGVWVWLDVDLTRTAVAAHFTAGQAQLPQLQQTIERHAFCLRHPGSI